jgi:hypothetical protein
VLSTSANFNICRIVVDDAESPVRRPAGAVAVPGDLPAFDLRAASGLDLGQHRAQNRCADTSAPGARVHHDLEQHGVLPVGEVQVGEADDLPVEAGRPAV